MSQVIVNPCTLPFVLYHFNMTAKAIQTLMSELQCNASRESNFARGTILVKGFPQAQVHTLHSTSAEGEMMPLISFYHRRY